MSCNEDFFSQFTPLTRDGRPVRDDDGLLVFVRRTDGKYVSFRDSQIQMEGLDSYMRNDVTTKGRNAIESSSGDQYGLQARNAIESSSGDQYGLQARSAIESSSGDQYGLQARNAIESSSGDQYGLQARNAIESSSGDQYGLQARNAIESSSGDQYGLHDTNSDHEINSTQSIMLHPQLHHQNCQVLQTNVQCSPMQVLSPHVMHTQHNVLQLQPSHHHSSMLQLKHLKNPSKPPCATTTSSQTHQQHSLHLRPDSEHNLTEHSMKKTDEVASTIVSPDYMSCTMESTLPPASTNTTTVYTKPNIISGHWESGVKSEQVHGYILGESQENLHGCNPPPTSVAMKTTQPSQDVVWMNIKTPEARMRDKVATQKLIEIVTRPDTQAKLAAKSTKKKVVWQEIGEEMGRFGFIFENPGDKCSQKWRNIERGYKDYVMRKSMSDMGTKREPEFYHLLSQVLKDKHVYESVPVSAEGEEDGPTNQDLIDEFVDMDPAPREVAGCESVSPNMGECQGQVTNSGGQGQVTNSESERTGPELCGPEDMDLSDTPRSSRNEHYGSFGQVLAELNLHRSHVSRMESVLLTVQQLLEEQKRDRQAMRTESRERFAELKSLIENNHKEKMKFMYDFLKSFQFGKGGKRKRAHADSLDNCSDK